VVLVLAEQVHLDAVGPPEHGGEQADRAGAEDQQPFAGGELDGLDAAQRVAAGLDHRAAGGVHGVRQGVQVRGRHRDPLGERPGQAVADAQLVALLADVVAALAAPAAVTATDHRVPGHPPAPPGGVDARSHRADPAAPLVAGAQRVRRGAGVQVAHVAGEQLDVGAADAGPLDVHHHLPAGRGRRVHLPHFRLAGAGEDQGAHQRGPTTACRPAPNRSMPSSTTSPGFR
jgi:hypothetical protein